MKELKMDMNDECIVTNALNFYWHDANDNLKRKDLGDIEREQYQIQLCKSKDLLIRIDLLPFNNSTLNDKGDKRG